ncbi:MAG: class I SAM-dependent methyltransferase [Anaerolineales bacterium]|nr:class I SAM-dependent methyltransferase [Anaerolineales bacterium]
MSDTPAICNYEGSSYRTDFWEGRGRQYEDQVERVALRRLLPPTGKRLVEVGGGFGRLTDEFTGYQQVVIMDYSRSLLEEAQKRHGTDGRIIYVAANIYQSPLATGSYDAATMIRVIHHMRDVPAALGQVRAALAPGATFVLEFANKRNFKAMLRHLLRLQKWSPYSLEPVEFVELNFDFHPRYMAQSLQQVGFSTERRLAVSHFRLGILKRLVPMRLLVGLDSLLQPTGQFAAYAPSIFTQNIAQGDNPPAALDGPLFKCPQCASTQLDDQSDVVVCQGCGTHWDKRDGIYDFREPLSHS